MVSSAVAENNMTTKTIITERLELLTFMICCGIVGMLVYWSATLKTPEDVYDIVVPMQEDVNILTDEMMQLKQTRFTQAEAKDMIDLLTTRGSIRDQKIDMMIARLDDITPGAQRALAKLEERIKLLEDKLATMKEETEEL
jgi:hypothetical protein